MKAKEKKLVEKFKKLAMRVEMSDGSTWQVPVMVIAWHRAERYKEEFDGDTKRSLLEDTLPLFEADAYEIEDWAENNMNWEDVDTVAYPISRDKIDFQEGWVNGNKEIVELEE